jgi:hypothetical protein
MNIFKKLFSKEDKNKNTATEEDAKAYSLKKKYELIGMPYLQRFEWANEWFSSRMSATRALIMSDAEAENSGAQKVLIREGALIWDCSNQTEEKNNVRYLTELFNKFTEDQINKTIGTCSNIVYNPIAECLGHFDRTSFVPLNRSYSSEYHLLPAEQAMRAVMMRKFLKHHFEFDAQEDNKALMRSVLNGGNLE